MSAANVRKMTVPQLREALLARQAPHMRTWPKLTPFARRGDNCFGSKEMLVKRLTSASPKRKHSGGSPQSAKRSKPSPATTSSKTKRKR